MYERDRHIDAHTHTHTHTERERERESLNVVYVSKNSKKVNWRSCCALNPCPDLGADKAVRVTRVTEHSLELWVGGVAPV